MDTFLSEIDEAIKKEFELFAQDKLAPIASSLANREVNMSDFLKQLAEAGYPGINVPKDYGGKESTFLQVILLAEALAHYEIGTAVILAYHAACIELIKQYGSAEQKNLYLPKLASGKLLGTVAHLRQEEKTVVVLNELPPTSSLILAFANENFFFLSDQDKKKLSQNKMSIGLQSICFANLTIAENSLNNNEQLGGLDVSAKNSAEKLYFARNIIKTILAAASVGISQSILNQSVAHTKTAERNGQPLSRSEAIQWKLADLSVESNAARLLTYRAACSKDEDKQHFPQYAAMCKAFASRVARFHTGEGLQVLAPLLNDNDSSLPRFYLDSKMLETFEATNEEEKVLLSECLGIK